ncbi:Maf family protein [Balneolales bacterium ANBcel1]|nr:Maf family protein [Balneolales bacterium ANBcel1]
MPVQIILASSSPRRRLLLRQIGVTFEVVPAAFEESVTPDTDPETVVEELALAKARMVAEKRFAHRSALVIGADTLVVRDREILGKPEDAGHAAAMLRSLSGRTHQVFTGVALILTGEGRQPKQRVFHERTDVTFGTLSDDEIRAYIESGSPMDKAGAYGIQDDLGALFVKGINGDYYNVVGFPLFRFYREVNKLAPGVVTPFGQPATGAS